MVLSRRLREAAALVTPGNRLADIGTDHGFVPIFLVEEGKIPSAVAMDVNPGPLQRAEGHIQEHGLGDRIRTRLSDGLSALGEKEADTILIAGMGGALCVRILQQGARVLQEVKELVLQPQSEITDVRRYLEKSGWRIVSERMVLEDGKYYQMMRCIPGQMRLDDVQARYGPILMRERSRVWISYLQWLSGIFHKNLTSLEKARGERAGRRREEILGEISILDSLLSMTGTNGEDNNTEQKNAIE